MFDLEGVDDAVFEGVDAVFDLEVLDDARGRYGEEKQVFLLF